MAGFGRMAALTALLLLAPPGPAAAHGGGLNAEGCHNDRRNGGYHGHRVTARSSPAPRHAPTRRAAPASPARAREGEDDSRVHYRDCSAARAAGAAPVRRGDPGYAPHLDRDGDGIGCE